MLLRKVMYTLQPRVNLINNSTTRECSPISAILECGRINVVLHDLVRLFQNVGVQTARDMPCDVTMERPDAWII